MKDAMVIALASSLILCLLGAPAQRMPRETPTDCAYDHFWNGDMSKCLPCSLCRNQSKTPGCESCPKDCEQGKFWNFDTQQCLSCSVCLTQPKTPQCSRCRDERIISTPGPNPEADIPIWTWILICFVSVAVPLAAVVAWIKSKDVQTSAAAKPVQEIGFEDVPEAQNLTSE